MKFSKTISVKAPDNRFAMQIVREKQVVELLGVSRLTIEIDVSRRDLGSAPRVDNIYLDIEPV